MKLVNLRLDVIKNCDTKVSIYACYICCKLNPHFMIISFDPSLQTWIKKKKKLTVSYSNLNRNIFIKIPATMLKRLASLSSERFSAFVFL